MKKLLILLLFPFYLNAQIINIEDERIKSDSGWAGNAYTSFNLTKNKQQVTNFDTKLHVQYKRKKNTFLNLSSVVFVKAGSTNFSNSAIQHLRYNYQLKTNLMLECYTQSQYNKIIGVKFRQLLGAGIRYKLYNKNNLKVYGATSYMYEYEEMVVDPIIRNHRISNYVSTVYKFNDRVKLISTFYYQPVITDIGNYKFYTENDIEINVSKKITF